MCNLYNHSRSQEAILTKATEWERWLTEPWAEARAMQRSLVDEAIVVLDDSKITHS